MSHLNHLSDDALDAILRKAAIDPSVLTRYQKISALLVQRKPTRAEPAVGSVWIEEVVHSNCRNCGQRLRRHPQHPGISGGIAWYHPATSHLASNGFDCPELPGTGR